MYEGVGVFFLTNTPKTNDKYFKIALNVNIRIYGIILFTLDFNFIPS